MLETVNVLNKIIGLAFIILATFFAHMTFESLSLKTNTVYYSCSFDFYIVNDHQLEKH